MMDDINSEHSAIFPRVCDASVQCGGGRQHRAGASTSLPSMWNNASTLSNVSSLSDQEDNMLLRHQSARTIPSPPPEDTKFSDQSGSILASESDDEDAKAAENEDAERNNGSPEYRTDAADDDDHCNAGPDDTLVDHVNESFESEDDQEGNRHSRYSSCSDAAACRTYNENEVSIAMENALNSLDTTFQSVEGGRSDGDICFKLAKLLCQYYPYGSDLAAQLTPENVLLVLEECLNNYKQEMVNLSMQAKQLENELINVKESAIRKQKCMLQEHKERLTRLGKDHEDELRAAVERAVNARQQSNSLQEQLESLQKKLETKEKEAEEESKMAIKNYKEQLTKWGHERHKLLKQVSELENLLRDKAKEVESLHLLNESLQTKSLSESKSEREYVERLEKELAKERARSSTLKSELQQEKERNHFLWCETKKHNQQMASLESRLEALCSDVSHRDRLLAILKEEILAKVTAHTDQERLTLASLDLMNDDAVVGKWSELVNESLVSKDAKIAALKKEMNDKELALVKLSSKLKDLHDAVSQINHEIEQTEAEVGRKKRELSTKKLDLYELELNLTRTLSSIADKSARLNDAQAQSVSQTPASSPGSSRKHRDADISTPLNVEKFKARIIDLERQNKYLQQQCKNRDKQVALLQQDMFSKDEKITELSQLLEVERGNINYVSGPDLVRFSKTSPAKNARSNNDNNTPEMSGRLSSSRISGRGSPLGAEEGSVSKQKSKNTNKLSTRHGHCALENSDGSALGANDNNANVPALSHTSSLSSIESSGKSTTSSNDDTLDSTSDDTSLGDAVFNVDVGVVPVCHDHATSLTEGQLNSLSSYFNSLSATTTPVKLRKPRRAPPPEGKSTSASASFSKTSSSDSVAKRQQHQSTSRHNLYHSTPSSNQATSQREGLHSKKKAHTSSIMIQTD